MSSDKNEPQIPTINGKRISCSYNVRLSGFIDSWLGELQEHSFELPLIIHDCKTQEADVIRKEDVTPQRERVKGSSIVGSRYCELDISKCTPVKSQHAGKTGGGSSLVEKDDVPITPVRKLPRKKAEKKKF